MDLHFDVHEGKGPHLLMVHGLLSSRAQFELNIAALSQVSRPVVVELWGHGRSPVPEDSARFHPDAYVLAFEEIRNRLGVDTWTLCGQSLGAALTLRYALDFPHRITAQIFTNSTAALGDAEWADGVRSNAAAIGSAIEKGGREMLEQMPFHPKHATRLPESAKASLVADAKRVDPKAVARTMEFTVAESPVRPRVGENTVPALLVCGTHEKRFASHCVFAEENMAHLEVVKAEAGHAVNIEAAEVFNEAVTKFLSKHTQG